jgi:predicted transcriptional regulator YheO
MPVRTNARRKTAPEPGGACEADVIVSALAQLVAPLQAVLPTASEVVLHDLTKLPNSVAAIAGTLTGRKVGDPATDVLLAQLRGAKDGRPLRYRTVLPDGREARSTTVVLRSADGHKVAALCINVDVTTWVAARALMDEMIRVDTSRGAQGPGDHGDSELRDVVGGELFVHSVDELADRLIERSVEEVGVPVSLMKKQHKLQVVRDLDARGMFLMRDGIERAASALGVTRYTIYNYLNELTPDRRSTLDADETLDGGVLSPPG